MRTCSRSIDSRASCCGTPRWRTGGRTTTPRRRRLIVGDLVVSGTAGGEQGVRGFLAAYDQAHRKGSVALLDGAEAGRAGIGDMERLGIEQPGGTTWMTGVYDAALGLVYWTTGNPSPDYNGDERLGDNLYASSVVALDARSGRAEMALSVHAAQRVGLGCAAADGARRCDVGRTSAQAARSGKPQRLLLRARSRRRKISTGEAVRQAADVGARDRRRRPAGAECRDRSRRPKAHASVHRLMARRTGIPLPTARRRGCTTCRRSRTAMCSSRASSEWAAGRSYMGGSTRQAPDAPNQKILRAIDVKTGQGRLGAAADGSGWRARWNSRHSERRACFSATTRIGSSRSTPRPASRSGSFRMNSVWRASPMTYQFDGKQHIAIASGSNIVVFGLTGDAR